MATPRTRVLVDEYMFACQNSRPRSAVAGRWRLFEQENEALRKAAAYLAQGNLPGNCLHVLPCTGRGLRPCAVPAAVTCRVLGISRHACYQWRSSPVSQRDFDDAHLINAALDIHADDPPDGYRFIAGELARHGFTASENRVWRICSIQQIFSLHARLYDQGLLLQQDRWLLHRLAQERLSRGLGSAERDRTSSPARCRRTDQRSFKQAHCAPTRRHLPCRGDLFTGPLRSRLKNNSWPRTWLVSVRRRLGGGGRRGARRRRPCCQNETAFAALASVSPLPASSGRTTRTGSTAEATGSSTGLFTTSSSPG